MKKQKINNKPDNDNVLVRARTIEESRALANVITKVSSPYMDEKLNENDKTLLMCVIGIMPMCLPPNEHTTLSLIKLLSLARKYQGPKPTDTVLDELFVKCEKITDVYTEDYFSVKKDEGATTISANKCIEAVIYYTEICKEMSSKRRRLIRYKIDTREHAEKLVSLLPPSTIKKMDIVDESNITITVSVPTGDIAGMITGVIKHNGGSEIKKA